MALAAGLLLAGCGGPASDHTPSARGTPATPATAAPATASFVDADYLGRWRGVEGMYLVVRKAAPSGRYRLEMQWDLDHRGTFTAKPVSDPAAPGLAFQRDGKELLLRRTGGAATGLKYLAGKRDCLTVAPGEGYCRD